MQISIWLHEGKRTGIATVNRSHRIVEADAMFVELFCEATGCPPAGVIGADVLQLFSDAGRVAIAAELERMQDLQASVDRLQRMFSTLKQQQPIIHINQRQGDEVGGNQNGEAVMKVLAFAVVLIVAWVAYYMATVSSNTPPEPPSITEDGFTP